MRSITSMRALIITISLFVGLNGISQRTIKLSPPKTKHLDAPYKGEMFRYFTYHFNINTNLHSNSIEQIDVDNFGRIWFATYGSGFGMIDGHDLYVYGASNGWQDRVSDVFCDRNGGIWAGGNGIGVLNLLDGLYANWYIDFGLGKDISDVHIQSFADDRKGNVWVSTRLGGITCLKKDTAVMFTPENWEILETTYTYHMTVDKDDIVWFHDRKNIFYIENEELFKMDPEVHGIDNFKWMGCGNGKYNVIVIDKDGKVFELDKNGANSLEIDYLEPSSEPMTRAERDRDGNLYVANIKSIFKVEDGTGIPIVQESAEVSISDFNFDYNNSLWFGSKTDGLFYVPDFDIIRFPQYTTLSQLNDTRLFHNEEKEVYAVRMDEKNGLKKIDYQFTLDEISMNKNLHVSEGIYLEERHTGKSYFTDSNFVPSPSQKSWYKQFDSGYNYKGLDIYKTEDKNIHLGNGKDLIQLNRKAAGAHAFYKKEERYYIWLEEKRNERYSMGYYENNEFTFIFDSICLCNYRDTIDVCPMRLTAFHYINDTTFLVATWGASMFKITPNTCESIPEGYGTTILYGSKTDPRGNFWIGGIEGGLNYVDGQSQKVININESHGLQGSAARNLYPMDDGSLVCGTNIGVGIFTCKIPNMVVNSEEDFFEKYEFRFLSPVDGLSGEVFGGVEVDEYGRIWCHNRSRMPHVILPERKDLQPQHILFERIYRVRGEDDLVDDFTRVPGTVTRELERLQLNYGEDLHVITKAVYFKNTFGLLYQWRMDDQSWNLPQRSPDFVLRGLPSGEHELEFRAITKDLKISESIFLKIDVAPPFYQTAWFIILMILLGGGIFYVIYRWRTHVLRMRQKELERTVEMRTEQINLAKIELETQHNEIKDSISYAKRIQEAILPANNLIKQCLPESFILYKPKDIVAGDFYWLEDMGDTVVFAAADCTGHGVPGAMVSVVCHNALNRAVREFDITDPNLILDKTRELVLEKFESGKREVSDGMDIAVCAWNKLTNELIYAGANNSLYHVRNGELLEIKADKQPIGKFHDPQPFTAHSIKLQKDDIIYIFTDGFADQFGGDKGKKFKSTHFKKLLESLFKTDITSQRHAINEAFNAWKGELEQVDDVCVIGVRV